ncbi:MAG: hypothetical protein ACFFCS_26620 [Candidatus Hodarchaeota archaeon]
MDDINENCSEQGIENISVQKPRIRDLWDEIGFHKPMAAFWYNLILLFINLILGIILSGVLLNLFAPFPESRGYINITTGIFGFLFFIFDLATNNIMNRFIPEARIKDPGLMLKYIQFFIWYQMWTGLIQTSILAIYILFFVPETSLAYGIWFMLIASSHQYPGMLGVFGGVLSSLQHYNKSAMLSFIQGEIFQRITEGVFVLLGRWYGATHPEVGELMGIAFGAMIGTYADDFLATAVSAYFFGQVMKSQGIRARDCFRHDFTWDDIKEPLKFGIKTGIPGVFGAFTGTYSTFLYITYFPQYATWGALAGAAGQIMWVISAGNPPVTPLYAESYLNGKKKLTEYYVGQSWRYTGLLIGFFIVVFMLVYLALPDAFIAFNLYYYFQVIPFIIPIMLQNILNLFIDEAGAIIYAAHRPNYILVTSIIGNLLNLFIQYLILAVFKVQNQGFEGILFVQIFTGSIAGYIMTVVGFIYVQKTIVKIKIPVWQAFVAPALAALVSFSLGYLAKITIYSFLVANFGFYAGLIVMIPLLLLLGIFVYFPLTCVFGGWDEHNIETFEKVARMSGPSKFLVKPMFKVLKAVGMRSPLYNKFKVDVRVPEKEARELLMMKRKGEITYLT